MSEDVRVLTRAEALVAAASAAVLVGGLLTVSTASSAPAPSAPTPVVVTAPEPAPAAAPAQPVRPKTQPRVTSSAPVGPAKPKSGCPVVRSGTGKPFVFPPLPAPKVADSALPAALPPGAKARNLSPVTGKGVWVTNWPTTDVDVDGLVRRVKAAGLHSVWVRTGGTKQGYYGDAVLPELVPAAHAAGLKVIAWDFPFLSDPVADADRARRALAAGIDAFAPDIETSAEGTHATARRVSLYLSLVRSYAGDTVIAATVPRPTPKRRASFPYAAFAPYADVFVPMVYWSCNEPGALVRQSLTELGRLLPVHPVGQGYDMGKEGGRKGLPSYDETLRFLDYARRGGAVGASLWTIEKFGDRQWSALTGYAWQPRERTGG